MILSYVDPFFGDGKRHRIKAAITTNHPASSYGQPVIVLADGGALSWETIVLLKYEVVNINKREKEMLDNLNRSIQACTGYLLKY